MTTTNHEERPYPSVRQALFGNDHAANFRCAVKWTIWQSFYLLVAALYGLYASAMFTYRGFLVPVGSSIRDVLGPYFHAVAQRVPLGTMLIVVVDWTAERLVDLGSWLKKQAIRLRDWLGRNAERLANWLTEGLTAKVGLGVLYVVFTPIMLLALAGQRIDQETGIFTGIASILTFAGVAILSFLVGWASQTKVCTTEGAKRFSKGAKEKAKEMQERPGTQRIYGYCPVSFDITPKWFESLGLDLEMPWHEEDETTPITDGGTPQNPWSQRDIDRFMNTTNDDSSNWDTSSGNGF